MHLLRYIQWILKPIQWLSQCVLSLGTQALRIVGFPVTLICLVWLGFNLLTLIPLAWISQVLPTPEWVYELLVHWRLQLGLLGVLGLGWFIVVRYQTLVYLSLGIISIQAWLVYQALSPLTSSLPTSVPLTPEKIKPISQGGNALHVLQANVFIHNMAPAQAIKTLTTTQADMVVLQEVDAVWRGKLLANATLKQQFPMWVYHDASDVLILSRLPVLKSDLVEITLPQNQTNERFWEHPILVSIQGKTLQGTPKVWHILGIHPPVPFSEIYWKSQQAYVQWVQQLQSPQGASLGFQQHRTVRLDPSEALIVLGDFNTTPYSQTFQRWQNNTGLSPALRLVSTCQTLCLQPSWPSMLGLPFLQIPIDHAFVSKHIHVLSREPQASIGSDHLPVMNVFAVAP
ncbi:MAG: endonuclease/exonuclease/phosphatase family protein [Vampirovibrionales bacterium]